MNIFFDKMVKVSMFEIYQSQSCMRVSTDSTKTVLKERLTNKPLHFDLYNKKAEKKSKLNDKCKYQKNKRRFNTNAFNIH